MLTVSGAVRGNCCRRRVPAGRVVPRTASTGLCREPCAVAEDRRVAVRSCCVASRGLGRGWTPTWA
jgi:hypothetical protein